MKVAPLLALLLMTVGAAAQPEQAQLRVTQDGKVTNIDVVGAGSFTTVIEDVQRLRLRGADADAEILAMIEQRRDELPPPYYLEAVRRTCESDPATAREWLALYSIRARYDGLRCADETALQSMQMAMIALQAPQCRAAVSDRAQYAAALEQVAGREDLFAASASPWWICSSGISVFTGALEGKATDGGGTETWLRSEAEWSGIRTEILDSIQASIAKQKAAQ